jgi:hypothetical protein
VFIPEPVADGLGVGQVAIRNAFKGRCHFSRGLNVEGTQPLGKGASSGGIDVLPNIEHTLIITYTLVLTGASYRAKISASLK